MSLDDYSMIVIIALGALVIGSFLNVVIYRLPKIIARDYYNAAREYLALAPDTAPPQDIPQNTAFYIHSDYFHLHNLCLSLSLFY